MLKQEAINQAYGQIRISGLTTDVVPEESDIALFELDQVMTAWRAMGRNINYNFPLPTTDDTQIQSNPEDVLGVYDWAEQGVIATLAANLVEYYGKEIPAGVSRKQRFGVNVIKQQTVKLDQQQYPHRMPIGSGNRFRQTGIIARYYWPSYKGRADATEIIVGQNLDMTSDFTGDLQAGDDLVSYTIEANGRGITLQSDSRTVNVINYRVLANKDCEGKVSIVGTTLAGLVIPKAYCFDTVENTCVVTHA
jgi:hypothetical protein